MEFDNLGKKCYMCHQQDFLPIECDLCNKFFCLNHSSIDYHQCPNFNDKTQNKKKQNMDKLDTIHKYLQKKTIDNSKIKFTSDRIVPDDKNYHTYTDIPLNSEDEMSELDLKEGVNNNKSNKKGVINTCGICYRCNIM